MLHYVIVFCSVAHKDLADNVFATMDRDLSASSDEGEEEEEVDDSCDEQQPPQLQSDPENSSLAQSDDLASNFSENIDDASVDDEYHNDDNDANDGDANDVEADVGDGNDDASVGSGDDGAESDVESDAGDDNADTASNASGKLSFRCSTCLSRHCSVVLP